MRKICPCCNNIILEKNESLGFCTICGEPFYSDAETAVPAPEVTAAPPRPSSDGSDVTLIPQRPFSDDSDVTVIPSRPSSVGSDVMLIPPRPSLAGSDVTVIPSRPSSADSDVTLIPPRPSYVGSDVTLIPSRPSSVGSDVTAVPSRSYDITSVPGAELSSGYISSPGMPTVFRDCTLERQFKTRGAEADIFLVNRGGLKCVLKLYRLEIVPKKDILDSVQRLGHSYHEHILPIEEFGYDSESGRWYEIQEFIPYGSMNDIKIDSGDSQSISSVIREISEALDVLHKNGIIHCDLKPSNVFVRTLEPLDLVLADFGTSSILDAEVSIKMTDVKGTPMYWAPEAFSGNVAIASDWWSLGTMVCELLLGRHPFAGIDKGQIILKLTQEGIDLSSFDFSTPPLKDYELLLKGLLTKSYRNRWGGDEVKRWLSGERSIKDHYIYEKAIGGHGDALTVQGNRYGSAEEIIASFVIDEAAWNRGVSEVYRGILDKRLLDSRQYEMSSVVSDIKEKYGGDRDSQNKGLFELIYKNNRHLPFTFLGKVISIDNLRLFVKKTVINEATEAEAKIVDMTVSGAIKDILRSYADITGKTDDSLASLFEKTSLFANETNLAARLTILSAILSPEAYFWPVDVADNIQERVKFLKETKVVPVSLSFLKDFVFTKELLNMLMYKRLYGNFNSRIEKKLYLTMADVSEREVIEYVIPPGVALSRPGLDKVLGLTLSFSL